MLVDKTAKELAFIKDLYIASDWGERFAQLFDENLKLINEGRMLYVEASTGGHALLIQKKLKGKAELFCVDESQEIIEIALAKALVLKKEINYHQAAIDFLQFEDNEFDLVIGDGSLIRPNRIANMLSEMVRVASQDSVVALALPTAGSFGEFFSIFWEALLNADLSEHDVVVESLISALLTVSDVEELAQDHGLINVTSSTKKEEFDFESGEAFLTSPLIADFLLPVWFESLPDETHESVRKEIVRVIDESRDNLEFDLSVKATLVSGTKM